MVGQPATKTARPYRSHKFPACKRCHKRRSRCTIERAGEACLLCRLSKVTCSAESRKDEQNAPKIGFVRRPAAAEPDTHHYPQVLGPVMSRDTQILDTYAPMPDGTGSAGSLQTALQTGGNVVFRSSIPTRRPSPPSNRSAISMWTEALRQVEPHLQDLLKLYFEELHPCLPLFNEQDLWARLAQNSLHQSFLTNLVAYTTFYWSLSPQLADVPRPDQDFVWQAAVSGIDSNSQRGDVFSIAAAVLNIEGRPSKGVVHNTGNAARITALSHGIGLNHNCASWNLGAADKDMRVKLWWAVVIHDRWLNFAQGTPPYINRAHYDVPLPSIEAIISGREQSVKHQRAAECYVALCQLTEIVGDVLPLIYHIRSGNDSLALQQTLQAQVELDRWLTKCPGWLVVNDINDRPFFPGLANLQLSYLAVRMLLSRIIWHENCQQSRDGGPALLLECLDTAEVMVAFAASLTAEELLGFWLPYNAHHFTSAVTLLLRCAFQTDSLHVRTRSISAAYQMGSTLKLHYENARWDVAEIVLAHIEAILKRVENAVPGFMNQSGHHEAMEEQYIVKRHDDANLQIPWSATQLSCQTLDLTGREIEEIFPELFSEFIDSAFFDYTSELAT